MKKTLIVMLILLLLPALVLSVMNRNDDYSAEKALWKLNKEFQKVAADPKAAPQQSFDILANKYEKLIERYKASRILPIAKIYYGKVYAVKEDYPKARKIYQEVIDENQKNMMLVSMGYKHILQTYAAVKDFSSVVRVYEHIKVTYPFTELGIRAPLDIARMYAARKEEGKKVAAINSAVYYYKNLMGQDIDPRSKIVIMKFLTECYFSLGRWEQGVDVLKDMLIKYPDPEYFNASRVKWLISSINAISASRLKDYDKPVEIYTEFIEQNPEHPYRKVFEDVIEKVKQAKIKQAEMAAEQK